jgi:D-alanyl-D-alanine carboxypeptidase
VGKSDSLSRGEVTLRQATYRCVATTRDRCIRCGSCVACERRVRARRHRGLVQVPSGLRSGPRPLQVDADALAAYERLVQAARAEGISPPFLRIISAYRDYDRQARLWRERLLAIFKRMGCSDAELACVDVAIGRANRALSTLPLPHPRAAWHERFLRELSSAGCAVSCDPTRAVETLRRGTAPPGLCPHHTGRALDIHVGGRVSMNPENVGRQRQSSAYRWLVCNGGQFGFTPYLPEPWHWEYTLESRSNPGQEESGGSLTDTGEFNVTDFLQPRRRLASRSAASMQSPDGLLEEVGRIDVDRATRLNDRNGQWLLWQAHMERILGILGLTPPLQGGVFADAVARWQQSHGLRPVDGVIGPCTWSRMRAAVGLASVPCVSHTRFVNRGTTRGHNRCSFCPMNLGVGIDRGAGPTASNGMELQFTISGHRLGMEYDILRTRRTSFWQRRDHAWRPLEFEPAGTNDDPDDNDEWLRPTNDTIFVIDNPGWPNSTFPVPHPTIWESPSGSGAAADADAIEVVSRASFVEWVIARNASAGTPWTPISLPVLWHSVVWLRRRANLWTLDPRSRIERGALSAMVLRSAPR